MSTRLPYPPPFQDLRTLSEHVCLSERTIENAVKMGQFPAPKMQGGKRLWRWKDVEKHLAADTDAAPSMADSIREATRNALQSR